jgi:hypothetical protein
MPDPESIDIQFSLMDRDALENFTNTLAQASADLAEAKGGVRSTPPSPHEAAAPVPGRSEGASVAQPSPIIDGSGGTSSAAQPGTNVRSIQNVPSATDKTPEDAYRGLNPLGGGQLDFASTYPFLQQARQQDALQQESQPGGPLAAMAGRLPIVGSTVSGALNANSIGEGLSFAMANHVFPAIASSQALQIGTTGINPFAASQLGYEQGLTGGSTIGVGPFQMQLPTGPAASSGFADVLHSITTGATTGGLSTGQIFSNEQILHAVGAANYPSAITAPSNQAGSVPIGPGTTAEDFNAMRSLMETIQKPRDEGGLEVKGLDPQILGEQIMNMTRYGNATQQQVLDAFNGLGEAARSANLSINDFAQQVTGAADALQQMGPVTNVQAFQAAMDFSSSTHLPPASMSALMQSPLIQGQMIGQTGLPPALLPGAVASDPSLLPNATLHTINMLSDTFKNQFQPQVQHFGGPQGFTIRQSSSAQGDEMAAQTAGIPLDEFKRLRRTAAQTKADAPLTAGVSALEDRIKQITNATGGVGSQYAAAISALEHGHGKGIDFQDLIQLAQRPHSGIDPADIKRIRDETTPQGGEAGKAEEISRLIKQARPGNISPDPNKQYIGFTGYAEKVLRQVMGNSTNTTMDQARKAQSQGGPKSTSQYLHDQPTDPRGYLDAATNTAEAAGRAIGIG